MVKNMKICFWHLPLLPMCTELNSNDLSFVPLSLSLALSPWTFPGREVQSISPWMYVTMMMTDQIPLDLAPPPILNGEVPLMPHMVNGDAAQQVNTLSFSRGCRLAHLSLSLFFFRLCWRAHSLVHAVVDINLSRRHFPLLSFHHRSHGLLQQVMKNCQALTGNKNESLANEEVHVER